MEGESRDLFSFGVSGDREGPGPAFERALSFPYGGDSWTRLVLTIGDGDRKPLEDLELTLWRKRQAILFAWPEAERVELVVLDGVQLAPAGYPLEEHRRAILASPWRDVALDLEAEAARERISEGTRQVILTAALAAAALVLLAILARSIRSVRPPSSAPPASRDGPAPEVKE